MFPIHLMCRPIRRPTLNTVRIFEAFSTLNLDIENTRRLVAAVSRRYGD